MSTGFSIGYMNFTILLLLLSGICMLSLDVKTYERAHLKKEKKTARILAWFNISLSAVAFIGNLIFRNM
ncbi:hypothetical protein O9H85_11430 [Paenibacillus filicis]|uniref:Uncharacterized protein n=1 Tax=Paenibacillus gyeongsangnamensis TaxID=3388067 RepID=A0ABT4Q8A5_9BACL|nr:CLC_0170 family protein [Paenibacillus filicis]MCZ8513022.1 hypothetical protein [Paenibacillus filicis]